MKRSLIFILGALAACGPDAAPVPAATIEAKAKEAPPKVEPPPPKPPEPTPWDGRAGLFESPKLAPSTKVDLGEMSRSSLANGLNVIAVPRHQVPSVDVTIAIRAGDNEDPIDKIGLASFTAAMLRKGTATRTADAISDAIDFSGGSLNAGSRADATIISCHARTKDLGLCLDLVADLAQHPTFPDKEMGEVREQMIANVEQSKDNLEALAKEHVDNLVYGDDDIRGRVATKKSIAAIDAPALAAFHKKWFLPTNAEIAIAGDFDAAAIKGELEKRFAEWKKEPPPPYAPRTLLAPPPKPLVRIIDKPDATQTAFDISGPGIAHKSRDYYAVLLMNYTLGGGAFSSRLMKVVRSEGGKTYGARSHFDAHRDPGAFYVETYTRTSEAVPTLKLLFQEIEKMAKDGPTAEELDKAKGNIIGGYGLRLQTASDIAESLLLADTDGCDAHYIEKMPERIAAVTREDVQRVAAAYMHPTAIAIAGKASEVKPALEHDAELVRRLDDSAATGKPTAYVVKDLVEYREPVSAAERKALNDKVLEGNAAAGKKLLADAIAAQGIANVKSLHIFAKGETTMEAKGQSVKMAVTVEEYEIPGKAHREDQGQTMHTGDGVFTMHEVVVVNDGKGFTRQDDPTGQSQPEYKDMTDKEVESNLWGSETVLLRGLSKDASVTALPAVIVKGVNDDKQVDVLLIMGANKQPYKIFLDAKTHLPAGIISEEEGTQALELLTDWRKEGGAMIAHTIEARGSGSQGGVKISTTTKVTTEKVEIDGKIDPKLLQK